MSSIIEDKGEKHIDQPEGLINKSRKFSRRSFLKGGAATGAALALESLGLGCLREGSSMERPLPGKPTPISANTGGGNQFRYTTSEIKPNIILAISPEQALKHLQDTQQRIEEIYQIRDGWNRNQSKTELQPTEKIPSPALGKIFAQVTADLETVQKIIGLGKEFTADDIAKINNIYRRLTIASEPDKEIPDEELFYIEFEAKKGAWIAQTAKELLIFFPKNRRGIGTIKIESRNITWYNKWGDWIADAGTSTFEDHRADIFLPDHPDHPVDEPELEWERKKLLQSIAHEFAHSISPYSNGYNLKFIPVDKLIALILEDTRITDQQVQLYKYVGNQDESFAYLVADSLGNTSSISSWTNLEFKKSKLDFANKWFSEILGTNIDLIEIGRQVKIR